MKRLFFSAICLVAFSSVSMGNTIAEKQVVIENELQVDAIPKIDVCAIIAIAIYVETLEAGAHTEDAAQEALAGYNECVRNQ